MTAKLISIIGPPGVGKTTLAEHVARELGGEVIYEDYAGNPFLADAYTGRAEAALPAQMTYLLSRLAQLSLAHWPEVGVKVSDYGFCQDRVFANMNLDADDLAVYERLLARLEALIKRPDVLVCLDAPEEVLLERIARRGRAFEQGMTGDFLACLRRSYAALADRQDCAVVRVDAAAADFRAAGECSLAISRIQESLDRVP